MANPVKVKVLEPESVSLPKDAGLSEAVANAGLPAVMLAEPIAPVKATSPLALTVTATVDAEMLAALTAMDAVHKIRETTCSPHYADAVLHLGLALLAAVRLEGLDSDAAAREIRKRLIVAAKARTETPRILFLQQSGVTLPPDKQPKARPGAYYQAYNRVMDLARWLPNVGFYRVASKRGRGEHPVNPDDAGWQGIMVQGTAYRSPLDALVDNRSLESVHQAWCNYIRPAILDLADYREQAPAAVRANFGRFFVTVRDSKANGGKRRVKIIQRPEMLAAVVKAAFDEAGKHGESWSKLLHQTAISCLPAPEPPAEKLETPK